MKYNYVVFLPWKEYAEIMYSDLSNLENVDLVYNPFKNIKCGVLLERLYNIHFCSRFSKFFPFKSIWNKLLLKGIPERGGKLCFVFFISDIHMKRYLFQNLKNRYPNSRFVMYLEDTVASRKRFDHATLNKYFDLVLSYDAGDCKKYGYIYYPTPYSKIMIQNVNEIKRSNLFYCGLAKKRFDTILNVYNKCKDSNIKCDFIVCSLPSNKMIDNGIKYIKGMMPYSVYLQHLMKTQCILEVNQAGAEGYSLRVWEALVYGKKLITNNKKILKEPFYDSNQFLYFDDSSTIDIGFFKKDIVIEARYIEELSPKRLIQFIENNLLSNK